MDDIHLFSWLLSTLSLPAFARGNTFPEDGWLVHTSMTTQNMKISWKVGGFSQVHLSSFKLSSSIWIIAFTIYLGAFFFHTSPSFSISTFNLLLSSLTKFEIVLLLLIFSEWKFYLVSPCYRKVLRTSWRQWGCRPLPKKVVVETVVIATGSSWKPIRLELTRVPIDHGSTGEKKFSIRSELVQFIFIVKYWISIKQITDFTEFWSKSEVYPNLNSKVTEHYYFSL